MPNIPTRNSTFRFLVGLLALSAGIVGLVGLYVYPIPEGNREPLLVALGIVLGWGSNVVQAEFGGTTAGKKLTNALADKMTNGEE